jgi:hypothetical protein
MADESERTNDSENNQDSAEVLHLLQADRRDQISRFFRGPWVLVRSSEKPVNGWYVFGCLIRLDDKARFLQHVSWDFRRDDLQPRVECVSRGSGEQEVYYLKHGNDEGAEPLFHCRFHSNQWPASIEVAEEFRLFFNLHHDHSRNVLLHCDVNGSEEEVARIGTHSLEIKLAYLVRYLRAKQMHLGVQFDSHASSTLSLEQLGLKPDTQTDKSENYHFELSIRNWNQGDEFRSVSRLIGKLMLPCSGPIHWEDPYAAKHESYAEFIVGIDSDGKPIRQSCQPEKEARRTNSFLTPVFFKREVLQKYFGQPERYAVEDGGLCCGGLWSLRLDNDHPKYVIVWLGDLGYLSADEQAHWKAFNVVPDGTFSPTFYTRNIRAWFADPTMPDLVFKQLYPRVGEAWRERFGWPLWKEPHSGDEYVFNKLHVSLSDEQSEFDEQNVLLAKVLVDFLNEEELEKGAPSLPKDAKGGIIKLTAFLQANDMSGGEAHFKMLRGLQRIRSKGVHRKDEAYNDALNALGLKSLHRVDASRHVFQMAVDFLRWLQSVLIPSPPAELP